MIRVTRYNKQFLTMPRWSVWFAHEWPDGSPVLKDECSWRTARGIGINYGGRSIWLVLNPRKMT